MGEVLTGDPGKGLSLKEAVEVLQQAQVDGINEVAVKIDGSPSVVGLTTDKEGNPQLITDFDSPRTQPPRKG